MQFSNMDQLDEDLRCILNTIVIITYHQIQLLALYKCYITNTKTSISNTTK